MNTEAVIRYLHVCVDEGKREIKIAEDKIKSAPWEYLGQILDDIPRNKLIAIERGRQAMDMLRCSDEPVTFERDVYRHLSEHTPGELPSGAALVDEAGDRLAMGIRQFLR